MPEMNLWAVLVAAVSSFVLGGLWYSKALFGAAWMRLSGAPEQPANPARVFGVSFAFTLVAAVAFAGWLGPNPALADALCDASVISVGFIATSYGVNYQFSNRSPVLLAIDAGYHVTQFLLFALILGLWH